MKNLPEIDPEVRGLLEEIVKDPRSSMRLAPRHALLSWFDKGETVRPREVSLTSVERHLIEAYREDLAQVLYEAAYIAYWKAADLNHRPQRVDGSLFDPVPEEEKWRRRAVRRTQALPNDRGSIELLRRCIGGVLPGDAHALAQASLSLVPSDRTRCCVAMSLPEDQPRTAITALRRLRREARPGNLQARVIQCLGARLCLIGQFVDAREAYRESSSLDSGVIGRSYAFNLSCVVAEEQAARAEAKVLDAIARPDDFCLLEARDILRRWSHRAPSADVEAGRQVARRLAPSVGEPTAVLCRAYES